jgi:hypothetical protein
MKSEQYDSHTLSLYELLKGELTLEGISYISSCGTTCGILTYDDGVTVDIVENVDYLDRIEDYLLKNNIKYEVRCINSDDIFDKNYEPQEYGDPLHTEWRIEIFRP